MFYQDNVRVHCELNPKGFERLKAENIKKEEEDRIRAKKEKISQT